MIILFFQSQIIKSDLMVNIIITITLFFLIPHSVFAQGHYIPDLATAVLSAILGTLPGPCYYGFDNPDCIYCIGTMKFIPLTFFVALFMLVYYFVVKEVGPEEEKSKERSRFEYKIAAILSIVLALVVLHMGRIETPIRMLTQWVGVTFFVVGTIIIRSVFNLTGIGIILAILIIWFVYYAVWSYVSSIWNPIIEDWISICS